MAETETTKAPMPPYIAFKTLMDVIERMEREGPPTRVDTTYLDSYAGGYRPTVIGNLHTLGLLSKTNEPTGALKELIGAQEPARKKLVAALIHANYTDVLALPPNSTQGEFLEKFTARGAQGDTRRKAISFFLKACTYADVPVGTHWKTPPAGTSSGGRRRAAKPPPDETADNGGGDAGTSAEGWTEIVDVNLGNAGQVRVLVGVQWLQLNDETFVALRKAINDLKVLAAQTAAPNAGAATTEEIGEDES